MAILFNEVITDIMCGYKLLPSQSCRHCHLNTSVLDLRLKSQCTCGTLRQRPYEVEVSYKARTRAEGKSISVKDALAVISSMATFRMTHRRKVIKSSEEFSSLSIKFSFLRNFIVQFIFWIVFFPGFFSGDSFAAVEMAKTGD
jgi:hypothetical protein